MGDYRYMGGKVKIKPEFREAIGKRCIEYTDERTGEVTLINNEEWTELGLPSEVIEHPIFKQFLAGEYQSWVPFTYSSALLRDVVDYGPNSYVDGVLTFQCAGKDYSSSFLKFVYCLRLIADEWEVTIDSREFCYFVDDHLRMNEFVKTYTHDVETAEEREIRKAIEFGANYGMGSKLLESKWQANPEQSRSRAHRKAEDTAIEVNWSTDDLGRLSNRQLKRLLGNEGSRLIKSMANDICKEEDENIKQQLLAENDQWERGPKRTMRGGDVKIVERTTCEGAAKIVHIDSLGFLDEEHHKQPLDARQAHNGLYYFPGDAPQGHGHKAKPASKNKRKAQKAARRKQRK